MSNKGVNATLLFFSSLACVVAYRFFPTATAPASTMDASSSSSFATSQTPRSPKAQTCYAASRNKGPILGILERILEGRGSTNVLEIASGTGEHAAYFCSNLENLVYQTSALDYEAEASWRDNYSKKTSMDRPESKDAYYDMDLSIKGWAMDHFDEITAKGSEMLPNINIDVETFQKDILPTRMKAGEVDLMICVNMIHISGWKCTDALFKTADDCLKEDGMLYTYGPYSENGQMTDSNRAFDESLKQRNPDWGVRDVEDVKLVAEKYHFYLDEKVSMPANNLSLIFRRKHD